MSRFIDPKTLARVRDLPLVAKTLAQGFLQGLHDSHQRGIGIEFSQYRVYEPGDELAKIDWKLFARSDRYFVREADRESEINVWFVLDCSNSMQQSSLAGEANVDLPKDESTSWNKQIYSKYLISTMAYLAQKQGDAIGFLALSSEKSHYLPAFSGEQHWQKLLIELTQLESGGHFPPVEQVNARLAKLRKNGLIVLLSDFHQNNNEITDLVSQLANQRTDVVAFHLSTQDEISFPYQGAIRFEDLETQEQRLVSAEQVRKQYLASRAAKNAQLNAELTKHSVQHVHVNIDQPLDQSLYQFLNARRKVLV